MKTALMMITISALVLGGCATVGSGTAFDKDGLPKQQYYVGGAGIEFSYQPIRNGHIYVIEENSRKLFMTQPVEKDDSFDFDTSDMDDLGVDDIEQLKSIGVDPLNMRMGFYFVSTTE